jgi:excinuclease ABC subunit C
MKDKEGRVIYVGKAANIRKRVVSYFTKPQLAYKNEILVKQINSIKTIITASEHEAFLLESRLVKQFKSRYNISLKDDKSFPFIKITKEDYPRIYIGRKKPGENVEYVGPYTDVKSLRLALKSLRKAFPFCTCRRFPRKECLNFFLGLCPGPCTDRISKKEYRAGISDFKKFLLKGSARFIKELEERMQRFSKERRFEAAIKLRDRIRALGLLHEQSRYALWQILGLDRQPRRIETFDISNLLGKQAVGSMVTFIYGEPQKDDYRRFKIRLVTGIDDYSMLEEILSRRYSRVKKEGLAVPDLIVIDGGKGHLNVARQQLDSLGLNIPIIAIAKEQELIYTVFNNRPVKLNKDDAALQLIQKARDEAHRFAIKYHKLLRKNKVFNN